MEQIIEKDVGNPWKANAINKYPVGDVFFLGLRPQKWRQLGDGADGIGFATLNGLVDGFKHVLSPIHRHGIRCHEPNA